MTDSTHKVLIVDDSLTNLALLKYSLAEMECEVVVAESGPEAIRYMMDNDVALILMDIQMPEMNGYEAVDRIKQIDRAKDVPVIFITAIYQDDEHVKRGYDSGAVDYLFRPLDVNMLKSKVRVFLQMDRQKMKLRQELALRRESEKVLREAEEKYRSIFERAVEGMFQARLDGVLTEVNPAMVQLFGYDSPREMIGIENLRVQMMVDDGALYTYLESIRRDGFISNFEFRARRRNGEEIWCSESSRLVIMPDGTELVEGVIEDITVRKKTELELKRLAMEDSLTGVPNRHLFFDRLEHALAKAKRYDYGVAILFVDLDEFKQVNDTYGHQTGDALLAQVAERLQKRIRMSDTLARLGGDEFGVLISPAEGEESARTIAEGLVETLSAPFVIDEQPIHIGATVGISFYPEDGKDGVSLISRADAAMYGAKRRCNIKVGTFRECGVPL